MSEAEPAPGPALTPQPREADLTPLGRNEVRPYRHDEGEQGEEPDVGDALLADVRARPPRTPQRMQPVAAAAATTTGADQRAAELVPGRVRRTIDTGGYVRTTLRRLRRDRLTMAAFGLLGVIILLTLAGPWVAQSVFGLDPYRQTLTRRYQPPSPANPYGADDLGRDVLARTLIAGRVSFTIGVTVAIVSLVIGIPIGLASGYFGGRFDDVSNAVIQTLANIPSMFLLILLVATLRPGPFVLAVIIGLLGWMGTARMVRGMALSVREREYVKAAQALGASHARIIFRHLLPNVFSLVTVIAGFDVAGGILSESGLSYLGLGVQPPVASWGSMLAASLENVTRAPWLVLFPGLAILGATLSIFLIADGLRDAMDPRLRS